MATIPYTQNILRESAITKGLDCDKGTKFDVATSYYIRYVTISSLKNSKYLRLLIDGGLFGGGGFPPLTEPERGSGFSGGLGRWGRAAVAGGTLCSFSSSC